tara:strand:+ start:1943 stop:2521 length:579 start_codon:yes stop_codon:yes gene_type:complete
MSQLKLTADGGGGTVSLKGPSSTTGNAAIELTVPGTGSATVDTLGRAGNILQVKQVIKTDSFSTSSESSVDVTGLSIAITPTSSSSKILVIFSGYGSVNAANFGLRVFLMRGISGTFTEIARNYNQEPTIQSQTGSNLINQVLDSPSTTNEVTYKLQINTDNSGNNGRIGAGGNNGTLNVPDAVITVMEVAA